MCKQKTILEIKDETLSKAGFGPARKRNKWAEYDLNERLDMNTELRFQYQTDTDGIVIMHADWNKCARLDKTIGGDWVTEVKSEWPKMNDKEYASVIMFENVLNGKALDTPPRYIDMPNDIRDSKRKTKKGKPNPPKWICAKGEYTDSIISVSPVPVQGGVGYDVYDSPLTNEGHLLGRRIKIAFLSNDGGTTIEQMGTFINTRQLESLLRFIKLWETNNLPQDEEQRIADAKAELDKRWERFVKEGTQVSDYEDTDDWTDGDWNANLIASFVQDNFVGALITVAWSPN